MKTYINPGKDSWGAILKRPLFEVSELYGKVQGILEEIKHSGDEALRKYTMQFDGVQLSDMQVSAAELEQAMPNA